MATQYTAGLVAGQVLTAATMNTIGAAWESYTPAVDQNGAVAVTVSYAKFTRINKLVIANVRLVVTGAGGAGTGFNVTLPITAASGVGLRICSGSIFDASTSTTYGAVIIATSTTAVQFIGDWSGANFWGNTPNLGLAVNDQIAFSVMYEIA